jgi:protein ImuA
VAACAAQLRFDLSEPFFCRFAAVFHGLAFSAASSPSARALSLLWRADQLDRCVHASGEARPTGHAALDAELPGGGWPAAGLTELLLPAPGCGELRLLSPVLANNESGRMLLIAPPLLPYAPALAALGIAPARWVVALPACEADAAWAAEQALCSGALAAVLWWQTGGRTALPAATLRRLHLAAVDGGTPLFALRPGAVRTQSSPAPLRLAIEPVAGGLAVDVFKRRGPPMAAPLVLALPGPHAARRVRRDALPRPEREVAVDAVVCPASARVAA